ncbi:MAG TPA: ABC transporter ATP-binding protein [Actinomycetota bacterium]|nr:ABC transporter ATP-binding protein [Actinomycetota bacterium]
MSPEALLELRGVTAGYGARSVLSDVTLSVGAGEVVGLVGPNGSGKTTLVRVASRTLRPSAGEVLVAGHDPYRLSGSQAARLVAVVPQDVAPAFSFTALEVTLMGRSPHLSRWGSSDPEDWAVARRAMAAVGVQHLADRPLEELSGGERQRVVLAQALAQDAPVLLLDEPTTHLDLRHVLDLLSLVRVLAERDGRAVLAVFHDLNLAASACDRVAVLDGGRLVLLGRPEEVLTHVMLLDVYGVEADVRPGPRGRPTVDVEPPRAAAAPLGRHAHVIGGAGRGAGLMRMLVERGFEVTAGVLHATDTDDDVAARLNLERITVPPFSDVDEESVSACRSLIARADVVVVCDAPYGPGNLANLELALEATESGTPVVLVEPSPIGSRDFTDGRASELWERLRARAEVAGGYEGAVAAIG